MPIHVFDLISTSSAHVPGNQGVTLAIAAAFPGMRIHVHADARHLNFWSDDPGLNAVAFHKIRISPRYGWRTHVVSFRRLWHDFQLMRRAIAGSPPGEPCLIMLLCASSTAIHAAALLARLSGRRVFVQVMLHGNLNDALSWRSRNPFRRALDFVAAFEAENAKIRFILLEDAIREEMARRMPGFTRRCDVLPHVADVAEAAAWDPPPLEFPIRVGLVGMATEPKGLRPFLHLAARFKAAYGPRIEFHIVGGRPPDTPAELFSDIAHPVEAGHIPRQEFVARMASLHYVLLPLDGSYYVLSPSGGLMDAVAWGKPVLATAMPVVLDLFRTGGDIGHICGDLAQFEATLHDIVTRPDPSHHARQASAMRRVAEERSPSALGAIYRKQTLAAFPELGGTDRKVSAPIRTSATPVT